MFLFFSLGNKKAIERSENGVALSDIRLRHPGPGLVPAGVPCLPQEVGSSVNIHLGRGEGPTGRAERGEVRESLLGKVIWSFICRLLR